MYAVYFRLPALVLLPLARLIILLLARPGAGQLGFFGGVLCHLVLSADITRTP
jgi:hypothetical protein